MNIKSKPSQFLLFFFILMFLATSCTDKNESFFPAPIDEDAISGKTIKYTIQLVSAANSGSDVFTLNKAKVFLVMNDSVYAEMADSSGIVSFGNLADGLINVRIVHQNFYTFNYLLNLKASDSISYESGNFRNVASLVRMLPKADLISAQLSVKLLADLNETNTTLEFAPLNTGVSAFLSDSVQMALASVSAKSTILEAWLEMPTFYAQSDAQGELTLQLPVSSQGLEYNIVCEDFYANYTNTAGESENALFISYVQTKKVYPLGQYNLVVRYINQP